MAHMIKGNGSMQSPVTQQQPNLQQSAKRPVSVVVGAVVNKPGTTPSAIHIAPPGALQPGILTGYKNTPGILQIDPSTIKQDASKKTGELANTKEKTPMCLVNELARYNKIQHQYTLTDEQGPAHQKTFYVKLKLGGSEEYAANGASIKKAQHSAAAIALEKTGFTKPPAKVTKAPAIHSPYGIKAVVNDPNKSITPTVELNSLVMRRGESAEYRPIEVPRQNYFPQGGGNVVTPGFQGAVPSGMQQGPYPRSGGYRPFPRTFYVSLKVGEREFIGQGNTRQAARHSAAENALKELKTLPLPDPPKEAPEKEEAAKDNVDSGSGDNTLKSEISQVHEIALKRQLGVTFEVLRESGPPHLKTFLTSCTVGNITVEGDGNSKKSSKKRAAEAMLEKLQALPTLPNTAAKAKKPPLKKKNRNLIKIQKASPDYGMQINPISRLIQIQQAKKEKEPVYMLIDESGKPRKREFTIQVQVGNHRCNGVGPNKKLAKRHAAELMLQELGYSKPSPQPAKPAIKTDGASGGEKKVTFIDQESAVSRQVVPGVILMPDNKPGPASQGYGVQGAILPGRGGQGNMVANHSPQTIATIAKELLEKRTSATAEVMRQRAQPNTLMAPLHGPEQQLLYMGEVLGFAVSFTDFPKGNKNECLSLVTLSTTPPQVSHGAGANREASHDAAAIQALRALALFDTNTASGAGSSTSVKTERADHRGDGFHIKTEM